MKTLSLESDSLTIHHLVDLLILIPDIRGAWPVPLANASGSALSFVLSTSTGTGTITITITSKVDRRSSTMAKELILPCEEVFFIISDPPRINRISSLMVMEWPSSTITSVWFLNGSEERNQEQSEKKSRKIRKKSTKK